MPVTNTAQYNLSEENISLTDSSGNTIHLSHPAQRIVCQNSRIVELFIVLGAGDRIIGVPDETMKNSLYSPKLPNARSIGSWQVLNIEKIITLDPDVMILYSKNKPRNLDQLNETNITLAYIDGYILQNLPADARKIGILTGQKKRSEEYAQYIERYMGLIQTRLENQTGESEPRVYVELYSDYSSSGKDNPVNDVMHLLHAKNIGDSFSGQSYIVSPEWVVDQDPDIILKFASSPQLGNPSLATVRKEIIERPGFSNISAVRNDRVYVLSPDAVSSPKGIAGTLYLAKILHPDRFSDIDPQAVFHEYAESFFPGIDSMEIFSPS